MSGRQTRQSSRIATRQSSKSNLLEVPGQSGIIGEDLVVKLGGLNIDDPQSGTGPTGPLTRTRSARNSGTTSPVAVVPSGASTPLPADVNEYINKVVNEFTSTTKFTSDVQRVTLLERLTKEFSELVPGVVDQRQETSLNNIHRECKDTLRALEKMKKLAGDKQVKTIPFSKATKDHYPILSIDPPKEIPVEKFDKVIKEFYEKTVVIQKDRSTKSLSDDLKSALLETAFKHYWEGEVEEEASKNTFDTIATLSAHLGGRKHVLLQLLMESWSTSSGPFEDRSRISINILLLCFVAFQQTMTAATFIPELRISDKQTELASVLLDNVGYLLTGRTDYAVIHSPIDLPEGVMTTRSRAPPSNLELKETQSLSQVAEKLGSDVNKVSILLIEAKKLHADLHAAEAQVITQCVAAMILTKRKAVPFSITDGARFCFGCVQRHGEKYFVYQTTYLNIGTADIKEENMEKLFRLLGFWCMIDAGNLFKICEDLSAANNILEDSRTTTG